MFTRVVYNIIVLILLFIAPVWLTLLTALFGIFFFRNYFELVFLALCAQFLYSGPHSRFLGIIPLAMGALCLLVFAEVIRARLRRR